MKVLQYPTTTQWEELCTRPTMASENLDTIIQGVFDQVKQLGDQALFDFGKQFDGVELNALELQESEWNQLCDEVNDELKQAIQTAAQNIQTFHASQQIDEPVVETSYGVECWRKSVPIQRVGLYIPGGSAPLFSTVLMLGIPAQIANNPVRILCTPPNKKGSIHPAIAYAAKVAGIQRVFKVGGAQAIAAMSLGTASIPKVDKLFGPGNQFVTAAKMNAQRLGLAIDMPAGPSEVLVAADDSIPASFVAADLLAQAEHGEDSQVVFVTDSVEFINEVQKEVTIQLNQLPRAEIAKVALSNSWNIVLDSNDWSDFINTYAPEHLIVMGKYEDQLIQSVYNAGSVFIGPYTAESFGDYASGTNHTLPTAGFARTYSGVSLDSFVKKITYQRVSEVGLKELGPTVVTMATAESLDAHANAVLLRMNAVETRLDLVGARLETTISNFIRPEFRDLRPYSSARDEFEGNADVYLDANENGLVTQFNRYPDPLQIELKETIAELKGFNSSQLFLGNGSDEVLDLIFRLVGRPNLDKVAYLNPSYGMYSILAKLNGLQTQAINLDENFEINTRQLLLQSKGCKLLIICNPNNPTGKVIPRSELVKIIEQFKGVVVIDEAYSDFCPDESCIDLINDFSNLIVTQTLSKAYGMAGLRVGIAIANSEWIKALNSIKPPYNISSLVQQTAIVALKNNDWNNIIDSINNEKERVFAFLENCDKVLQVTESKANFILFKVENSQKVYDLLAKNGVVVRNRSTQYNCENQLRVSIGTPEENNSFISLMQQL